MRRCDSCSRYERDCVNQRAMMRLVVAAGHASNETIAHVAVNVACSLS